MSQTKDTIFQSGESVLHKTKKDILAERIIEMITTGLLRDQDELPSERELAKLFEVSRETVRGALGKIAAYGLINVSQGSKTRVNASENILQKFQSFHDIQSADINQYNIDEVFEACVLIESEAVRKASKLISDDEIEHLKKLVAAQELMYGDPVRFQLSDQYFHKLLAKSSGNALFLKFSNELYNYRLMVRRAVMSSAGAIERSVAEHKAIVLALEKRDAEATATAMRQHLESVYQTSKAMLEGFTA